MMNETAAFYFMSKVGLTGDTRKIFVSNTVDESNSARVLIGCKPIKVGAR